MGHKHQKACSKTSSSRDEPHHSFEIQPRRAETSAGAFVGGYTRRVTPVPIPNTVVKPAGPMILLQRESRSLPAFSFRTPISKRGRGSFLRRIPAAQSGIRVSPPPGHGATRRPAVADHPGLTSSIAATLGSREVGPGSVAGGCGGGLRIELPKSLPRDQRNESACPRQLRRGHGARREEHEYRPVAP